MAGDNPRQGHRADRLTVIMGVDRDISLAGQTFRGARGRNGVALGDALEHTGDGSGVGHQTLKTSRASVTWPVMAAAATMSGLMSTVRPVWEPWRPLKFRFEELAQS